MLTGQHSHLGGLVRQLREVHVIVTDVRGQLHIDGHLMQELGEWKKTESD